MRGLTGANSLGPRDYRTYDPWDVALEECAPAESSHRGENQGRYRGLTEDLYDRPEAAAQAQEILRPVPESQLVDEDPEEITKRLDENSYHSRQAESARQAFYRKHREDAQYVFSDSGKFLGHPGTCEECGTQAVLKKRNWKRCSYKCRNAVYARAAKLRLERERS